MVINMILRGSRSTMHHFISQKEPRTNRNLPLPSLLLYIFFTNSSVSLSLSSSLSLSVCLSLSLSLALSLSLSLSLTLFLSHSLTHTPCASIHNSSSLNRNVIGVSSAALERPLRSPKSSID